MYIRADDQLREYGEEPIGHVGMAPAIAVEAGGVAVIVAIIEAIAFVASAAAAAYLLLKAYEAAQARGFGVSIAKRALTAGMRPMINMGRRIADLVRSFLQGAARLARNRPDCQRALFEAMRAAGDLERILAQIEAELALDVPRADVLRRLLSEMTTRAVRAKDLWQTLRRLCGPAMGPGASPA